MGITHTNQSEHTVRAYASELHRFTAYTDSALSSATPDTLRSFLATRSKLAPATRARTQAALSSFFAWAYRNEHIDADPMARIDRVQIQTPLPRGRPAIEIEKVLGVIPPTQRRDRVLFGLIARCGLRAGEALGIYVEDLDLRADDEHLVVRGKGGRQRTVLIDDDRLVKVLRTYLRETGYQHGPLFRASKNGRGGPLRYQSAQQRWAHYCTKAKVQCTMHQLRHSHATELVNGGVSLATIRKRLGHRSMQTTLRYAEQSDATADNELRAWRRKKSR